MQLHIQRGEESLDTFSLEELGEEKWIPSYLTRLVHQCLAKNPAERPLRMADIRQWLESEGEAVAAIPIASVVSGKSWLDWIKDHKRLAAWIGIIMSFLLAGLMVIFSAPKWLVFLPVIVAVVLRVMEVEIYIRDVDIDAASSKEIGELFHEGRISEAERDQYLEQEGVRRRERNQNVWVAFSIVILFLGVIVHEMLVNNKDLADVLLEEAVYLIGLFAFGVFAVTMRPVYRLF